MNTILEKKLEELEILLEEFGFGDGDLIAYREIELRFIFIKTLLAAEISSVKDNEEEKMKLACMAKRLSQLEDGFINQLTGPVIKPEMIDCGNDETGSVCSLNEGSLQGELQDGSLDVTAETVVVRKEDGEVKKYRLRELVSFGLIGLIAGFISLFGYFYDYMKEGEIFLTPT